MSAIEKAAYQMQFAKASYVIFAIAMILLIGFLLWERKSVTKELQLLEAQNSKNET